jgi:hypothetical protein
MAIHALFQVIGASSPLCGTVSRPVVNNPLADIRLDILLYFRNDRNTE